MSLSARIDLPLEVDTTLDASGKYASPWIDSTGTRSLRAIYVGPATVEIEYSLDGSTVLTPDSWNPGVEKSVSARYWRATASGTPNGVFRMSVRVMS